MAMNPKRRKSRVAVALAILLMLVAAPIMAQTVFEATTRGANCVQNSAGSRICTYHVGQGLEFSIAGVGEFDAGISFLHSDQKSDYWARMGMQHRCVVVVAGERAPKESLAGNGYFAFVSPRTGLVYRSWQECEKAR